MDIVLISDTHGCFPELPEGDLLIHSGDFSRSGRMEDLIAFLPWWRKQTAKFRLGSILVGGNHDRMLDPNPQQSGGFYPIARQMVDEVVGGRYLMDSGCEIEGLKFWGSPWQPEFYDWGFNLPRGPQLRRYWDLIPDDTDVLITHCPPFGQLDRARRIRCGCEDLAGAVERVKPRLHTFGHIHPAYGESDDNGTHFVNASQMNNQYIMWNRPVVVTL